MLARVATPTQDSSPESRIGVSRCGQAFVEYSFSNDTTPVEIRRATLNYDYDAVVSTALVRAGPSADYQSSPDRW
ncbi:MAG: hypothetical protein ACIAS6_01400, partial [Phycisphaerales bacterium JB060]